MALKSRNVSGTSSSSHIHRFRIWFLHKHEEQRYENQKQNQQFIHITLYCGKNPEGSRLLHSGTLRRCGLWRLGRRGRRRCLLLHRLLRLDVMLVDVLLDVQKRHLYAIWWVQDRFQRSIQVNVLTLLQTLLGHILVHLLRHLRTGNLLAGSQLQKLTQLLRNVQGLVETVGGGTSLGLLTLRVLNQVLHLAEVLAEQLDLIEDSLQSDGSVSH